MDIDEIRRNKVILGRIEETLQTIYQSNSDFNEALDTAIDPVSFAGLGSYDSAYQYSASEILYWVDRQAYLDELDGWNSVREVESYREAASFLMESDQASLLLDIVDAIRSERIVPFVGAGLSRSCEYPMWNEALVKLAEKLEDLNVPKIDELMKSSDYIGAAQAFYDASAERVSNFIRTEYRKRPNQIRGPHLLLPQISRGCIITTNFDTVIEEVFSERHEPLDGYMYGTQQGNNFVQRLLRGERCILKLHGDAQQDRTHVFTHHQYSAAYGTPLSFENQLPRALRQIFVSSSLLFLGCSLDQDRTLELFGRIVEDKGFDIPDHYAILSDPIDNAKKAEKEDRLLKLRIRPLWYQAPSHDHSMLEKILSFAIAVAQKKVPFQV